MPRKKFSAVLVPIAVVGVVITLVIPLPTFLLDILISLNITAAVLILLTSMQVKKPLDFSIFPSLLLLATMTRLALNVSATRLVLLDGYAGSVIESFGHFVVGGSIVVGLVVFLILIIIQFAVITAGAGRVAEVAARFTLDAMPGKQMAIDADLNAGIINEIEARRRREEISAESDFYGAMDGASKFVKGDAVAAVVITIINLLGGFAVGVLQKHMPVSQAIQTYSLLSVGDGLVSQIPALLLSVSTGLIVTRAATENELSTDLLTQFGKQHHAIKTAGAIIFILGLIPGLPTVPFLATGATAYVLGKRSEKAFLKPVLEPTTEIIETPTDSPEALAQEMKVEPLELELAFDLIDLVDPNQGGDLLDRVKALRRKVAGDLGLVMPPVRTRDNLDLPAGSYAIRLHGIEVATGTAPPGRVLVIGDNLEALPGESTREPVFGLPAKWVPIELRQQALIYDTTVVERSSILTTHLNEVVRIHAGRLLTRQQVKSLLDTIQTTDPVVIEELNSAQVNLSQIQRVLRELLEARIPIRDLVPILEAISERARLSNDPEGLLEAARVAVGPAISAQFIQDGKLPVFTLDALLEQHLIDSLRPGEDGSVLNIDPQKAEQILSKIATKAEEAEQKGIRAALVCSSRLRPALQKLVQVTSPHLGVLSITELGPQVQPNRIGVIEIDNPAIV